MGIRLLLLLLCEENTSVYVVRSRMNISQLVLVLPWILLSLGTTKVKPLSKVPDSTVHGANMGPIWDRQDPGGPQVGPMNLAIRGVTI